VWWRGRNRGAAVRRRCVSDENISTVNTRSITIDEIRRVEAEYSALNDRFHESVTHRDDSTKARDEWQRACEAFHKYDHPVFRLWDKDVLAEVKSRPGDWRNAALLFLEADPWFFRSGYLKTKIVRALKQADLRPREIERVQSILINAVDRRDRREYVEYCRLAQKYGASVLAAELEQRAGSSDVRLASRARQMLESLARGRPSPVTPSKAVGAVKVRSLRAIAHNIADSLASGIGLLIGVYEMSVFDEAARSPERFITVDFLKGAAIAGRPSESLARAIALYGDALAELCAKHGTTPAAFRELTARYSIDAFDRHIVVTVEDQRGRRSVKNYVGIPARRIKVVDRLGRIRTT
jgi:hypothetical protein